MFSGEKNITACPYSAEMLRRRFGKMPGFIGKSKTFTPLLERNGRQIPEISGGQSRALVGIVSALRLEEHFCPDGLAKKIMLPRNQDGGSMIKSLSHGDVRRMRGWDLFHPHVDYLTDVHLVHFLAVPFMAEFGVVNGSLLEWLGHQFFPDFVTRKTSFLYMPYN